MDDHRVINEIVIHNFKSHKDTQVSFCPGVNVFIGLSDHGKTNVIRAINWVANNRPLGDGVINRDSTEASVELTVSHAKGDKTATVRRTKGKNINEYVVNGDNNHPFTAFGSDPPPQILDVMNLSEINLQRQFEPYFLVFDSPGQVATFIRSVTKLDEIDRVIDVINHHVKQSHTEIEVCNSEMGDVLVRLGAAARIPIENLQNKIDRARGLVTVNEKINTNITRLTSVVECIVAIEPIEIPEDTDQKLKLIQQKIEQSSTLQTKINRLNQILTTIRQTTSIRMPDTKEILNHINIAERKYNESKSRRDRLGVLVDQIRVVNAAGELNKRSIYAVEMELEELRSQLTLCPTCGTELTEESKERLLHCE